MIQTSETKANDTALCAELTVVKLSHADTLDTINAVRPNNAVIRKYCNKQ